MDHRLATVTKRDAVIINGAWLIGEVTFIFLVQGDKRLTAEFVQQFISGEIVMGAVRQKFRQVILLAEQLARQIESDRRQNAIVALGLCLQEKDRQIEGTGGSGEFIKGIAKNILFTITIPAPGGVEVRKFSCTAALVKNFFSVADNKFRAGANFSAIGRGSGSNMGASPETIRSCRSPSNPSCAECWTIQ
jgi:hypothetical protein